MRTPASVLSDIRVLDLTQFLAGATCTMLLGDLGADVVKVERPDGGDAYRRAGPPFVGDDSVPFLTTNRNKRSLAVDLSHPAGTEVRETAAGLVRRRRRVAALRERERERDGRGVVLDANLFGTAAWWGAIPLLHHQVTGSTQPRTGNIHPHIAPYQLVVTADGYVAISAPNEPSWRRLCQAIGAPEFTDDPRFSSNPQRRAHVDELSAALEERFRQATTREWVETLSSHDVACGPVHSHADVLADPERRWHLQLLEYPDHGREVALPALPVRWNGTVAPARRPAPALGADNDEILSDLGFQDADVRRFAARGSCRSALHAHARGATAPSEPAAPHGSDRCEPRVLRRERPIVGSSAIAPARPLAQQHRDRLDRELAQRHQAAGDLAGEPAVLG